MSKILIGLSIFFGICTCGIWVTAYNHGVIDAVQIDAPGCVIRSKEGFIVTIAPSSDRHRSELIPKDATLTASCLKLL